MLQLEVEGEDAAVLAYEARAKRARDLFPALTIIEKAFFEMERRRFSEGGPGWAPLAESTIERKQAFAHPSQILVRAGNLEQSLTSESSWTNVTEVEAPSVAELIITANPVDDLGRTYARWHQEGFYHMGGRRVPRRPPVHISSPAALLWGKAIVKWVLTGDPIAVEDYAMAAVDVMGKAT